MGQPFPETPGYTLPAPTTIPPITQQPVVGSKSEQPSTNVGLMALDQPQINVPTGLQYLATTDTLLIKQKVERLELFTGFETNNKYTIKNDRGDVIYYAIEDNNLANRMCFGSERAFDINIVDNQKNKVLNFTREMGCDSCLFTCCLHQLMVHSGSGNLMGTVVQTGSMIPEFDINDKYGKTVLKIQGPLIQMGVFTDAEYKIMSVDNSTVVGKISKKWSGLLREMFTDSDYFGISFPINLDVHVKAVLLGACFLIDFMYFEN